MAHFVYPTANPMAQVGAPPQAYPAAQTAYVAAAPQAAYAAAAAPPRAGQAYEAYPGAAASAAVHPSTQYAYSRAQVAVTVSIHLVFFKNRKHSKVSFRCNICLNFNIN